MMRVRSVRVSEGDSTSGCATVRLARAGNRGRARSIRPDFPTLATAARASPPPRRGAGQATRLKEPAGEEGRSECGIGRRASAQRLGATLGVVDRQRERERSTGREDTAEVMATFRAPDAPAEKLDA